MPVRALTRAVLPWSMCPAVPTTTCFMLLDDATQGVGERGDVGVEDGAAVQEQAVVGDPANHGRLALPQGFVEVLRRTLGGANGERHRRKLHEGQRAAADLGAP